MVGLGFDKTFLISLKMLTYRFFMWRLIGISTMYAISYIVGIQMPLAAFLLKEFWVNARCFCLFVGFVFCFFVFFTIFYSFSLDSLFIN